MKVANNAPPIRRRRKIDPPTEASTIAHTGIDGRFTGSGFGMADVDGLLVGVRLERVDSENVVNVVPLKRQFGHCADQLPFRQSRVATP